MPRIIVQGSVKDGYKNKGEEFYEKLYFSARSASAQQWRIRQLKKLANSNALSEEQLLQVKDFDKPYRIPNMVFHKYFTEKTGVFDVRYIPQDLYVGYINSHRFDDDTEKILAQVFGNRR